VPTVGNMNWGLNDLQANVLVAVDNFNDQEEQYKVIDPRYPNEDFTPAALQAESVR